MKLLYSHSHKSCQLEHALKQFPSLQFTKKKRVIFFFSFLFFSFGVQSYAVPTKKDGHFTTTLGFFFSPGFLGQKGLENVVKKFHGKKKSPRNTILPLSRSGLCA